MYKLCGMELIYIHTTKKVLHLLGSTSSGTFIYKWNRDPHKQHFSSYYCSWNGVLSYRWTFRSCGPDCNTPSRTPSCIDACLYPSRHTIHKFIKALLAQIIQLLCTALHGVEVAKIDLGKDVGSEVPQHAAYCAQFGSQHAFLWRHEKYYSTWWSFYQGSSDLKSVSSGHPLKDDHSERNSSNRRWGVEQSGATVPWWSCG